MDGSAPTEFSDLLTLSTDEVGAIQEEQDSIVVHYGNGIIKFPSKVSFADVDWTLNCYCEPNVLGGFVSGDVRYTTQIPKRWDFHQNMKQVYFIKYDGQGNVRDVIKCPGTWIGALNNGNMNQQGGEVVKVSVPFVISRAIYLKSSDIQ